MQFLLGSLATAVFFVGLIGAYMIGRQSRHPTLAKPKQADEETHRKAEKLREGFEQMMKYDLKTALSGKKVT